jgi:hypothetical protein
MTSLTTQILGLSISYALLGVLLLTACLFTRLPWSLKAAGIVLTSAFYIVSFYATRGLLGWSSVDPLPPQFKLLHARIVEPHSMADDPGAIYLWIEAIDEENHPSGVPRAYHLPYDAKLAERAEAAVKASANGRPQGGRTADVGTGEGGDGQVTARDVTPSSITTTAGGDPSTGGPLDPGVAHDESRSIVFSPLPPPRMPPKDAVPQ